jgi:hypothetical protein
MLREFIQDGRGLLQSVENLARDDFLHNLRGVFAANKKSHHYGQWQPATTSRRFRGKAASL